MKKRIPALFLLMLFAAAPSLNGQTPFFQQYHPLKKNQPIQVNALLQDRKGFIWLGTDVGLFRFDGSRFKHYTNPDSLTSLQITALAEDSTGKIWMGHENGSLSYTEQDAVHFFETREGSAAAPISDILFDRNGTMWFSTRNDGLYYFVNQRLYRVDHEEGLPDLFIYDLFEDATGAVWAGTDAGIAVCKLSNSKIDIRVIDKGLPDIIIKKIKAVRGDTIGFATEDAGFIGYNFRKNEVVPLVDASWEYGSLIDIAVKENQVWMATARNGLVVYDDQIKQMKTYRDFNGVNLNSVTAMLKDREGNIWLGSKTGLSRTMGDALEHFEGLLPGEDNNVQAITVDAHKRVWFSTSKGLFVRTPGPNGSATITKKLQNTAFSKAPVISLFTDAEGYIWAGLYGTGLLRLHPDRDEIKHFQKELRNGNILSITGKGNTVWVATLGGSSSIRFDRDQYIINNYSSADGLSSDFTYQVFVDSKGRIWFATDGKGVSMLDEKGFHQYARGLTSPVVYNVAEDIEGNIWVSSQDNGVFRFDGNGFQAVHELRLRDNSIHALLGDGHGNLIAIHDFGIDVFDVRTKKMRYWGEETGIKDKQANLNAVAKDQFGQYFIGTTKGFMKFTLNNDHTTTAPQPVIDAVSIFGESIDITKSPQLKYNENNVTVHYLGFWFQNSDNLNYLYKLENYDLEWISTRNQEVTYSRLPAGEYSFKVKVSDTDDFDHAQEASLTFSISPPFWRTSTFYIFIVGAFVIGAYGLMKYRERKLLEDKIVLEARVEERTKEIQQKTEEIQAQNEEIMAQAEEIQGINENLEMLVKQRTAELEKKNKALEEYAFINAHKLRSPVASILGLVNLLAKSDQREDTRVIREHLKASADKLDAVVRSITKAIEKADNKYL